ncbi:glutathione S-transferase family protein [Caulobacter sp. ErkDOM-E]|uniref:glutathione S-transferase family protein n=1 Tax=Caulobacter sp. ErkDOM-E TaxID=3402778 RepID=UPI003AF668D4
MLIVHGLDLSYFTGKLEGYLRAKGLPYRLQEMDTAAFRALALKTGVRQMPQLELPDGRWMTDTPVIIDRLETDHPLSSLTPTDPALGFLAALIETYGDEHLWRPALYYRWAYRADAQLMSGRLADGMFRDIPLPRALRRQAALLRQRSVYLGGEGVSQANRFRVEADYLDTLEALDKIFARRDWLLGEAPTRADIGLFGPLFRHFACDPTPAGIMRARAPSVAAWVARLWALKPDPSRSAALMTRAPDDLGPLMDLIEDRFLPEMAANQQAVRNGAARTHYIGSDVAFQYRANAYRAWRLGRLQAAYAELDGASRRAVDWHLGPRSREILLSAAGGGSGRDLPSHDGIVRDRWWRPLDRTP